LEHGFYHLPYIGNVIIPTGELIFFRGVGSTTNQQNNGLMTGMIWGYPVFRKPLNSYVKIENCDKPLGPRGESSWFILAGLVPLGFYSMVYTMVNGIFIGFIGSPEIFCTEKKGPA
jgi:hypothetical protein